MQMLSMSASPVPVSSSKFSSCRLCYKCGTTIVQAMLQHLPVSASLVPVLLPNGCKFQTFIGCLIIRRIERRNRHFTVRAEQSDTQFEIDRVKAKEALKDLDQQLLSLSHKQIPKTRFLSKAEADISEGEPSPAGLETDVPDVSGSYLVYAASFLVIITVLNNIAFNMFIKPSVDNKGPPPASSGAILFQKEIRQAPPL